ncbi:hypothetical protein ACWCQK_40865, partial [Streptomyces sp. NPDC002306]
PAPDNLIITMPAPGRYRLRYRDEDPRDRDMRGVLWGRCSLNPVDGRGRPTGAAEWKMMHPFRQRHCMQNLLCQVCAAPARTPKGWIFLAGPGEQPSGGVPLLLSQPPVCARCVRPAARLCPHLEGDPTVFLARSAPLYGVYGVIYGYAEARGVHVVAEPDVPLPFGHANLPTFLASQLFRRLSSYRVLSFLQLIQELDTPAV